MTWTLAVESEGFASFLKLLLAVALLLAWARWATLVDKDAMFFHLQRRLWNAAQIAAVVLAFAALLLIPFFFIGLPLAVLLLVGTAVGYVVYRNGQVDEKHHWHLDAETLQQLVFERRDEERAQADAALRFASPPEGLGPAPATDDKHHEPHMLLEQVVEAALARRAQRIDMAATENRFASRISIDGVEHKLADATPAAGIAMLDYLKAQCGMEVGDRRRKQVGGCRIELVEHGEHKLRVHTAGSTRGLSCTVHIDPEKQIDIPFEKLGLLDAQRQKLQGVFDHPSGVVLVAAPPAQGGTTTLYALLQHQDPYTMDIQTIEPMMERDLEGITQHEIDPAEVPRRLDSLLLRDPQVVMVAEIPDEATARSIARAGVEGKRMYTAVHGDDGLAAIRRWYKLIGDAELGGRCLAAVLSQRLVRKLCTVCRQKYKPDEKLLKKLNLPGDRIGHLYKRGGQVMVKNRPQPCPACNGIGYEGRIGTFEVFVFDDDARKLLAAGKLDELRTHLRRQKTMWLQEAVLAKVVAGVTSIREAMRALGRSDTEAAAESQRQAG